MKKRRKNFDILGSYLKKRRVLAGLSQAEVGRELGYTTAQFVSNFERGLCSPPLSKIRILLSLYRIPVPEMTRILLREQKKLIQQELHHSRWTRSSHRQRAA